MYITKYIRIDTMRIELFIKEKRCRYRIIPFESSQFPPIFFHPPKVSAPNSLFPDPNLSHKVRALFIIQINIGVFLCRKKISVTSHC